MSARARKTDWKPKKIVLLVLALTALALLVMLPSFLSPGNVDFYVHQSKYQNIVAKIKTSPLTPGKGLGTRVDGLKVNAERNLSGSYTVTITTQDGHHWGTYGYMFSDTPLTPHPDENDPDLQTFDYTQIVDQAIMGQRRHWWSVHHED